jgi:hypothetical protein
MLRCRRDTGTDMTLEDQALNIITAHHPTGIEWACHICVRDAIRFAIAKEREECAAIADHRRRHLGTSVTEPDQPIKTLAMTPEAWAGLILAGVDMALTSGFIDEAKAYPAVVGQIRAAIASAAEEIVAAIRERGR